jgi:hypothetical protein
LHRIERLVPPAAKADLMPAIFGTVETVPYKDWRTKDWRFVINIRFVPPACGFSRSSGLTTNDLIWPKCGRIVLRKIGA